MNWLELVVAGVILFLAIRGWNRGFLRILFSLVSIILLIGLVSYMTPYVSDFLRNHTTVYQTIEERCTENVRERGEAVLSGNGANAGADSDNSDDSETSENGEKYASDTENDKDNAGNSTETGVESFGQSLPDRIAAYIADSAGEMLDESGIYEAVGSRIADWILAGISYFAALCLASIVLFLIGRSLRIVDHIPVLRGINRTLGIFVGALQGLILVWLFFLLIALFAATEDGQVLIAQIDDNFILRYLYYNNILLKFLPGFA